MSEKNGLVFAFSLNGNGGGKPLTLENVKAWRPGDGTLWVHLDYTGGDAMHWLRHESGIDPVIVDALETVETRPRSLMHQGGMLVILRGVNLNPGASPEDMISIRLWIDADRIVTLRHRRVMAIDDLRQAVVAGSGPAGPGAFLERLCDGLVVRMGAIIADVDDSVDAVEDEMLTMRSFELRQRVVAIRRIAIAMRRYLAPQRDVMARLPNEVAEWLDETQRRRLREIADRTTRYVEDLDAVRDRATVTQEELSHRLSEQMNTTMYVLSIVAGVFLPLGFLTGLLGINVGGIPGTDSKFAFTIFCIVLLGIAGVQVWFFKRKKWM
ncbi:MAG: zinc transporter ZntB [Verrucomicrobia bacterium]|nr:zinc transporter ZntB [Verrucomicrobiota bacterium]MDA1088019.1 zinc transporter ZntB [Verrucomicrobiota bacterium]